MEMYSKKLKAVGFSINNDPYLPSHEHKFSSDMSQWPRHEYMHVSAYSTSSPETCTQAKLLT